MNIILTCLLIVSAFAQEFAFPIKETKNDLNGDGNPDTIKWTASAKGVNKPDKLVITVDGKEVLIYENNFCKPGEENGNPDGCINLKITALKSKKNEALLEIRSTDTQSSVDQSLSGYLYRWNNGDFSLISAKLVKISAGIGMQKEKDTYSIDYSTGNASLKANTVTKSCTLKDFRKNEKLSSFSLFDISSEVLCK